MPRRSVALDPASTLTSSRAGLWWGLLGVAAFSFTVIFTRVAVGGLSPMFVGSARAVIAALLAAAALTLTKQRLPSGIQWARLAVVAGGVVVGFPMLTSYALTTAAASHGAVVIALLPAATGVIAVIRGNERPPTSFWTMAAVGAVAAVAFAMLHGGGFGRLHWSDLLLFGAVAAAAIGYAEGGMLARELGSWQTVSWALVLASPLMIALTVVSMIHQPPSATPTQWAALGYLAVVSMFLGFFAWYRGLAIGPMAQVSQVQLGSARAHHRLGHTAARREADLVDDSRRWRRDPLRQHRRSNSDEPQRNRTRLASIRCPSLSSSDFGALTPAQRPAQRPFARRNH